jgi:zinc transporter ZupT
MLILSIISLLLGPFIYELGRSRPVMRQFLDGMVFITIAGIVLIHIIPDAIAAGGTLAIVFLLLGLAFPLVLEHRFHDALSQAHGLVLALAALGIVIHAAIDGIALFPIDGESQWERNRLALGVVLHRLPVGMAVWWSVRPNFGLAAALAVFALMVGTTIAAFAAAEPALDLASGSSVAWFQAFVSGSVVHVAAFGARHEGPGEPAARQPQWAYRSGILLGLLLILTLSGLSLTFHA